MTILPDWSVSSLSEYQRRKEELNKGNDGRSKKYQLLVPGRPEACPECGAENSFWSKGYYFRWAVDEEYEVLIPVPRYRCRFCCLTVSLLFGFLVPYRQFTADTIGRGVQDYIETSVSYREEAGTIAGDDRDVQRPNHSQVARWVSLFCDKSADRLAVVLQRACVQVGKEDRLNNVGDSVCQNALRAHTVKKALRLNCAKRVLALAGILLKPSLNLVKALHSYFASFVQPVSSILTGRGIRLFTPQSLQHVIF